MDREETASDHEPVLEPLPSIVDPESFTPRLITLLANALVWRESNELRRRFGLGTNEWRVLSALATRPGWSATDVSTFLGMNKAIISKSVGTLQERGLIVRSARDHGARHLYLTPSGAEMHDAMRPISVQGEDIIQESLSHEEIATLRALLRRMIAQIPHLREPES